MVENLAFEKKPEAKQTIDQIYDASLEDFKKASQEFRAIQTAYRSREIGDDAFLKGKTDFDKAQKIADEAETAYIEARSAEVAPGVKPGPEVTAYDYGRMAFEQGINKAPDQDKAFLDQYIKGKEVGDKEGMRALDEWNRGFHEANVAAPVPQFLTHAEAQEATLKQVTELKGEAQERQAKAETERKVAAEERKQREVRKETRRGLLKAEQISDFEIGKDKVVREGGKIFVVDTTGQRAKVEVQSEALTPEYEANIVKLTDEQRLKMIEAVKTTPYLSDEGRKERLALLEPSFKIISPQPVLEVKEPWQMTDLAQIKRMADEGLIEPWQTTKSQNIEFMELQGLGKEGVRRAIEHHKRSITKALASGKPVPTEVLKDYPALVLGKSEIAKRAQEQYAGWKGKPAAPVTPEVTPTPPTEKLTSDIWNSMTPVERENLRVKALAASSFSDPDSLTVSKYWDEYWGEEKRALIREYKKVVTPTPPTAPKPKAERKPRKPREPKVEAEPKSKVSVVSKPEYTLEELREIHEGRSPQAKALDNTLTHQVTMLPDHPKVRGWAKNQGRGDILGIDSPPRVKRPTVKTPKLRKPKNALKSKREGRIFRTKMKGGTALSRRPLRAARK